MKRSKSEVHGKARDGLDVRFEAQLLTSFSGLIIFQRLFAKLGLKERLWRCCRHLKDQSIYGQHIIVMMLIVHLLLGFRELRDARYYLDDEMVKRLLGLKYLPEVSTVSRALAGADQRTVNNLRAENRHLVLKRLEVLKLARVTADFDGSVQSTGRRAEGTAVGFNKKKKGQRSYYPLFCTIAQTGQVLDVHHRAGNVHDSNGAKEFILQCLDEVWENLPSAQVESRVDSAFFSEAIIDEIDAAGAQFTASVPFERFPALKAMIEGRQRWRRIDDELSFFETQWKPERWSERYRFVFVRKRVRRQHKEPIQLDLFVPHEHGYDFKVIVTNKRIGASSVVAFHQGRGSQEGIFAELKTHCQMDYVPVTTRVGNQIYRLSAMFAHNLTRELQMIAHPPQRGTTAKRAALWAFEQLHTMRCNLIQRAGRLLRPQGKFVLSMNYNPAVEEELLHYLDALEAA